MAGENSSIATQSGQHRELGLDQASTVTTRQLANSHLEDGRKVAAPLPTTVAGTLLRDQAQRENLAVPAGHQPAVAQVKREQIEEFRKQEKSTAIKLEEAKTIIQQKREKVASIETSYKEYKDSWKFWRSWTNEKDGILLSLGREQELLKAQEGRLKELEKKQEDYKKIKSEYLALVDKPQPSNPISTHRKEQVLAQLRTQSASLDNLVVLDAVAIQQYLYREKNDKARTAWEKLKDSTYSSFSGTKVGRFVIATSEVAGKVAGAVKDGVVAVGSGVYKFVADPENRKKAAEGIKWACSKLGEGLKWLAGKLEGGLQSAADYVFHPEKLLQALGKGISAVGSALYGAAKAIATKGLDYILHPSKIYNDLAAGFKALASLGGKILGALGSAAKTIGSTIEKIFDFLTSEETWSKIGNAISKGLDRAIELIKDPRKLINAVVEASQWVGHVAYESVKLLGLALVDPNAAWDKLCKNIDSGMTKFCGACGAPGLWEGTKKGLNFIKGVLDDIGITSIIAGAANVVTMPTRLLSQGAIALGSTCKQIYRFTMGQDSFEELSKGLSKIGADLNANISEGAKQSARLFTGAYRLTMECTGLADIGRGIGYALVGNWKMAGIYFGLGAANLIAIGVAIVTAGAGTAIVLAIAAWKKAALQLGQKCLGVIGKELGEAVAKEFVEKTGKIVLRQQAFDIADNLVELCAKKGLSLSTIQEMTEGLTKKNFKAFFERNGLDEIVEQRVKKALQTIIDNPTSRGLKKALPDMPELATLSSKQIKAAREILISGKHFDDVTKSLTKEITESLSKKIGPDLEDAFAQRLRSSLAGEVNTPSARKLAAQIEKEATERGIPRSQLVDDYVKEARIGFRKGLREALEEVVEAAAKKAFRKLRFPEGSGAFFTAEKNKKEAKRDLVKADKYPETLVKKIENDKIKEVEKAVAGIAAKHTLVTKQEKIHVGGKTYIRSLERADESSTWKIVGQDLVDGGTEKPLAQVALIAETDKINLLNGIKKDKRAA